MSFFDPKIIKGGRADKIKDRPPGHDVNSDDGLHRLSKLASWMMPLLFFVTCVLLGPRVLAPVGQAAAQDELFLSLWSWWGKALAIGFVLLGAAVAFGWPFKGRRSRVHEGRRPDVGAGEAESVVGATESAGVADDKDRA